jgi:hypothetical protein
VKRALDWTSGASEVHVLEQRIAIDRLTVRAHSYWDGYLKFQK